MAVKRTGKNGGRTKNLKFAAPAKKRAGRDSRGKFTKGNAVGTGRPLGSANQTTTDLRAVKREIVESWGRCNGPKLLEDLARNEPREYLRLVCSVLPKDEGKPILQPVQIIITREEPPEGFETPTP